MNRLVVTLIIVLTVSNITFAIEDVSISLGVNYLPKTDVEIGEFGQFKETSYDNLFGEFAVYLGLPANFRLGSGFSYYSKTIAPETESESDVSIWGIGAVADYGYELTESGNTFFVLGVESGFAHLTDKDFNESNGEIIRKASSMRMGGFVGLRFTITPKYNFELDYIYNISTFDHDDFPKKHFKYSGSSVRISLNYTLFKNNPNEGSK